jgi:hypothetical protein
MIAALVLAIAGMAATADAQSQGGAVAPALQPAQPTTNGQAPSEPGRDRAPAGHRQPRAGDTPGEVKISPYDQQIDRDIQICRRC